MFLVGIGFISGVGKDFFIVVDVGVGITVGILVGIIFYIRRLFNRFILLNEKSIVFIVLFVI